MLAHKVPITYRSGNTSMIYHITRIEDEKRVRAEILRLTIGHEPVPLHIDEELKTKRV